MTMIGVTIPMKTQRTTDRPAGTIPRDDLQNIRESTKAPPPDLPDEARESTVDRDHVPVGHVTPERGTTVVAEDRGTVTEIVQVSAEAASTRKKIKRRKRRDDIRVLHEVGPAREMKRISNNSMFSSEK